MCNIFFLSTGQILSFVVHIMTLQSSSTAEVLFSVSPADGAHRLHLNTEQHLHCFLKQMSCALQVNAHWQGVSHIHKHLSDLTWCVVPSISTGTMKSALLIGYENTMWIWLRTLVG